MITARSELGTCIPDELRPLYFAMALRYLDGVLASAEERFATEDVLFAEFGSRHYSHPRSVPYSPACSHYMASFSGLEYVCFDPETDRQAFLDSFGSLYKDIGALESKELTNYFEAYYETLCKPLDQDVLHRVGLTSWSEFYHIFEDAVTTEAYLSYFPQLLKDLDASAASYLQIEQRVRASKKTLLYSVNVLNYPNLNSKDNLSQARGLDKHYPFWQLPGHHRHYVIRKELVQMLGFDEEEALHVKHHGLAPHHIDAFCEQFSIDAVIDSYNAFSKYSVLRWDSE